MFLATVVVLVVVGIWLGARLLRSRAQERRRRHGRPPMSLVEELRWLLLLLLPWGLLLATGRFAIVRSCYEDLTNAELAVDVSADEFCDAMLRDYFPRTVVAVSVVVAVVALTWTVTVLLLRAAEGRRAPVS
ncbi:hypothetical protein [Cellulomonas sp. Leaf334]|uniref:hypothetical protein n=1 Tax=Cellulomonas sp. Leaf334 TaxID=1736339 RepID=UPI0006F9787B|nr:hypothetical protein [Cellulomonas sp. Leaf334]KQR17454.1 hypothetical protein ASF78_09275 [Cellulomonas sp. Leaf334]